MVSKASLERALKGATGPDDRIAIFGALVSKESGLGSELVVVGGSAITVLTGGGYVSADIDLVGERKRIGAVLSGWGFGQVEGRSRRVYFQRSDLKLLVDIAGPRYSGYLEGTKTVVTKYGRVRVAAVEDLIIRRLVFWSREGKDELLDQAVLLYVGSKEGLNLGYLESEVRYERVEAGYEAMRKLAASTASNPSERRLGRE